MTCLYGGDDSGLNCGEIIEVSESILLRMTQIGRGTTEKQLKYKYITGFTWKMSSAHYELGVEDFMQSLSLFFDIFGGDFYFEAFITELFYICLVISQRQKVALWE